MSMKIDESTGLPEVPEKYFWRVENGGKRYERYFKVSLCRKRWIGRPRIVEWHFAFKFPLSGTAEEDIFRVAERLHVQEFGSGKPDQFEKFYGDYPPKRLETE